MNRYIVDSNFFIQAHRSIYPLDVVPSFWLKVKTLATSGIIVSIDKVKKEIFDKSSHQDQLRDWCVNNLPRDFFIDTDSLIDNYTSISKWVNASSQYYEQAKQGFLGTDIADPWLIALAMKEKWTIVTYEISQPNIKSKIKIPEVCKHFNIKFINTIKMFRDLNEVF